MNEGKPGSQAPPNGVGAPPPPQFESTQTSNNSPKGTMTMNTTDITIIDASAATTDALLQGAPVTAELTVADAAEVSSETEVTATTGDTTEETEGTQADAGAAAVVTETEGTAAADETEVSEEGGVQLSDLQRLASAWSATLTHERPRKGSTKPSKSRAKTAKAQPKPVGEETVVVETVATEPVVAETASPVTADTTSSEPVAEVTPAVQTKGDYVRSLKVGDEVVAKVKFKNETGAFVTVGGLAFGLLHVTEMPGENREQKKAFLSKLRGTQELTVRIVSIDLSTPGKERLGVSLIAGEKLAFFEQTKVGDIVTATVSHVSEKGAILNLGVTTGFMHVSEVGAVTRSERDTKLAGFTRGEALELVVINVDRQKQEVKLSQRRLPLAKLVVGETVEGSFAHVREGRTIVVELEVGALGFLPKKQGAKRYERGEAIVATVQSVDVVNSTVNLA